MTGWTNSWNGASAYICFCIQHWGEHTLYGIWLWCMMYLLYGSWQTIEVTSLHVLIMEFRFFQFIWFKRTLWVCSLGYLHMGVKKIHFSSFWLCPNFNGQLQELWSAFCSLPWSLWSYWVGKTIVQSFAVYESEKPSPCHMLPLSQVPLEQGTGESIFILLLRFSSWAKVFILLWFHFIRLTDMWMNLNF